MTSLTASVWVDRNPIIFLAQTTNAKFHWIPLFFRPVHVWHFFFSFFVFCFFLLFSFFVSKSALSQRTSTDAKIDIRLWKTLVVVVEKCDQKWAEINIKNGKNCTCRGGSRQKFQKSHKCALISAQFEM